jgi:hypothetical protein
MTSAYMALNMVVWQARDSQYGNFPGNLGNLQSFPCINMHVGLHEK